MKQKKASFHNSKEANEVMQLCFPPQRSGSKSSQPKKRACSGSVYHAVRVPVAAFLMQLERQPCVFLCVHACTYLESLHKSHLKSAFFFVCVLEFGNKQVN